MGVELVFGTHTEDSNSAMVTTEPNRKVVEAYKEAFYRSINARTEYPIIDYTATDSESTEILKISIDDIPNASTIIKKPTNTQITEEVLKDVKFTAFHFQTDEEKIIILREYEKNPFLSRKRLDRLIFSNNVLTFANKDSITVPRKWYCQVYGTFYSCQGSGHMELWYIPYSL